MTKCAQIPISVPQSENILQAENGELWGLPHEIFFSQFSLVLLEVHSLQTVDSFAVCSVIAVYSAWVSPVPVTLL